MRVFLRAASGTAASTNVPITGRLFVIGRAADCHLRPRSEQVSAHHCQIVVEPTGVRLVDLNSRNGTFVDGQRISGPHALVDGSRVRVGPVELVVAVFPDDGPADDGQATQLVETRTDDRAESAGAEGPAASAPASNPPGAPPSGADVGFVEHPVRPSQPGVTPRPIDVALLVASGRNSGTRIPIRRHRFLIGRAQDCHLCVHNEEASKRHCEIFVQPNGVLVVDLGSRNGTFVDGRRVDRSQSLEHGARLRVGSLELVVEIGSAGQRQTDAGVDAGSTGGLPAESTAAEPAPATTETPPGATLAAETGRRPLAAFGHFQGREVLLRALSGRNARQEIPIQRHRFLIGRANDCHLRAHSDEVSGHHCEIMVQPNGVLVLDLGSRNGTFVDGKRIEGPFVLLDGARLRVGSLELELVIREANWRRMTQSILNSDQPADPTADTVISDTALGAAASDTAAAAAADPTTIETSPTTASRRSPVRADQSDFDVLEFLSEPLPKTVELNIYEEVERAAREHAEAKAREAREKEPVLDTKEATEAAEKGLKRMFTPRGK